MMFRAATLSDAPLLHRWRTTAEREDWWQGTPTSYHDHVDWLLPRLVDPLVKMLIWEEHGKPAGTVRIDSNGEVAFHAVDDAAAVRMLRATFRYANDHGGRLKATVDEDDPKTGLLRAAGFASYPAVALVYKP